MFICVLMFICESSVAFTLHSLNGAHHLCLKTSCWIETVCCNKFLITLVMQNLQNITYKDRHYVWSTFCTASVHFPTPPLIPCIFLLANQVCFALLYDNRFMYHHDNERRRRRRRIDRARSWSWMHQEWFLPTWSLLIACKSSLAVVPYFKCLFGTRDRFFYSRSSCADYNLAYFILSPCCLYCSSHFFAYDCSLWNLYMGV